MRNHKFQGLEAPEIDQKSIRKRRRKQQQFVDRLLMDSGAMLVQKSIKLAIDFGIDFWKA